MKLTLRNIAGIGDADLSFKGITLIAGKNNTGKSSVGKAVYSVMYGISTTVEEFRHNIFLSVFNILSRYLKYTELEFRYFKRSHLMEFVDKNFISNDHLEKIQKDSKAIDLLSMSTQEIANRYLMYLKDMLNKAKLQKTDLLSSDNADLDLNFPVDELIRELDRLENITFESFIGTKVRQSVMAEFNSQFINFNGKEDSIIKLKLDNSDEALFRNNKEDSSLSFNYQGINLGYYNTYPSPIYIDTPLVLDYLSSTDLFMSNFLGASFESNDTHVQHVVNLLQEYDSQSNPVENLLNKDVFKEILEKISTVYRGDIKRNKDRYYVESENYGENQLNVSNLSSGLKLFAILKQIITTGKLKTNGVLIFDEPEIHEHPEWQIVLAEIIVLLFKYFNLQVIITSHSPYFIQAIEVFSKRYGVESNTLFYLSQKNKNGFFCFEDKTNEMESIYKLLAKPFQLLEDVVVS